MFRFNKEFEYIALLWQSPGGGEAAIAPLHPSQHTQRGAIRGGITSRGPTPSYEVFWLPQNINVE